MYVMENSPIIIKLEDGVDLSQFHVMEEINLQGTVIRNNEGPIEVPKNKMCKSKFNPIIWKRNVSKWSR
mgnify:CR=1 FL=1